MTPLRQKFMSFTVRERVFLAAGVVGVLLILSYALLWQPWQAALTRLRAQVPAKQETLAWMQAQAREIKPLLAAAGNGKPVNASVPLLTVIEQSAERVKLRDTIRRMTPDENDSVRVWFSDANFDAWLQWLEQLRRQGIEVVAATVNRTAGNKVTIRVTLQRP